MGSAYEREIHAFPFETSEAQDDGFIARMNAGPNRSHFQILFRNCANFSNDVPNFYFPRAFKRRIFPYGGIVTPRQAAYELAWYGRRHAEIQLTVMEIPLVLGYHRSSRVGESAASSFISTGYPILEGN